MRIWRGIIVRIDVRNARILSTIVRSVQFAFVHRELKRIKSPQRVHSGDCIEFKFYLPHEIRNTIHHRKRQRYWSHNGSGTVSRYRCFRIQSHSLSKVLVWNKF
jgi:hypothetical protein